MTIKRGEPAQYDGVLVPPLNYQNYKTFEAQLPELRKLAIIEKTDNGGAIMTGLLWFLGGFAAAVIVDRVIK